MGIKVALLGQTDWSLGAVNFHLKTYLSPYYQVDIIDWSSSKSIQDAFDRKYDLVIGEVSIIKLEELGYIVPRSTKILPMFRNGTLNCDTSYFNLDYDTSLLKKYNTCAASLSLCKEVKEKYNMEVGLLPFGVCNKFWDKQHITTISKLGHVSKPNHISQKGYESIKRSKMFFDIVNQSSIPGDYVYGKHFSEGVRIYEGFDMVICTSLKEGQPQPFLECAAAKIPFISTKVGIVPEYNSVKTFDTVEEAVEIIRHLNSSPLILQQYVNDVYNEVMADREWSKIIKKYWIPTINNILQK